MDSRTDVVFYLCVLTGICVSRWSIIPALRGPLLILAAVQVASWTLDHIRFGRSTALHAYTAKVWGVTLFPAAAAI